MKIGIVTFWWTQNNYGQLLQAYALSRTLKKCGHAPYLLRMHAGPVCPACRTIRRIPSVSRIWKHLVFVMSRFLCDLRKNIIHRRHCPARAFDLFRARHFDWSPYEYFTDADFRTRYPEADAFICGSDQIWNLCDRSAYGRNWFLRFARKNETLISFAASFGKDAFAPGEQAFVAAELLRFEKISVREKTALALCREAGRPDAAWIPDPTFLLEAEEYRALIPGDLAMGGIFCYFLNTTFRRHVFWKEIQRFSRRNGLPVTVVSGGGCEYLFPKKTLEFPTIPEWLERYEKSSYILTNSFHGTVFALIFHKPFLVFPLTGEFARMNSRITSLLESVGLPERLFSGGNLEAALSRPVDWLMTDEKLNEFRRKGLAFLHESLVLH